MITIVNNIKSVESQHTAYNYLKMVNTCIDLEGNIHVRGFAYSPDCKCFTYTSKYEYPSVGIPFADYVCRQDTTKINLQRMFGKSLTPGALTYMYTDSFGNVFTDNICEEYSTLQLYTVELPNKPDEVIDNFGLVANPERYVFKVIDRKSTEGRKLVKEYNKKAKEDLAVLELLDRARLEEIYDEVSSGKPLKTEVHQMVFDFGKGKPSYSFPVWCMHTFTSSKAKEVALYRMQRDMPKIHTHTIMLRNTKIYGTSYEIISKEPRSK